MNADIKDDNFSRIFFNYNYVNEAINEDIENYYHQFKSIHENDMAIAKNEFVYVPSQLFQVLEMIYGANQIVAVVNDKLEFYEKEEKENIMEDLKLGFEEQFLMDKIQEKSLIEDSSLVKILFEFNNKLNAFLDFKLETDF